MPTPKPLLDEVSVELDPEIAQWIDSEVVATGFENSDALVKILIDAAVEKRLTFEAR